MDTDRVEKLISQVLEDTRDFRQEINGKIDGLRHEMNERFIKVDERFEAIDERFEAIDERFEAIDERFEAIDHKFAKIDEKFVGVDRDLGLVKLAILDTAQGLKDLRNDVQKIDGKLDGVIADAAKTRARLDKLERAAE